MSFPRSHLVSSQLRLPSPDGPHPESRAGALLSHLRPVCPSDYVDSWFIDFFILGLASENVTFLKSKKEYL